ncbi:Hypothetical protein CINCED_3A003359 [Cinara cedri]|uniref:Large ribosomal subunit protein bL12 oligomerization domain-containing protein n=1 Tax=Cinara cedri TaxID=506608 RepID=A0A5E4N9S4_9HEMI|nr:Hypothetical protein CINCED_3A003359 [Cinara cedri]
MLLNNTLRLVGRHLQPVSKKTLRMYSAAAAQPFTIPEPNGSVLTSSPKLEKLYTEITALTMVEVAEFTELLKVRLNLKDVPMGAMVAAPVAAGQEDEEEVVTTVKTSFTVKLMKFDEKQKVALIKEVKNVLEGMNLVQVSTHLDISLNLDIKLNFYF